MSARHTITLGCRTPAARRAKVAQLPQYDKWLKAIEEAQTSRPDLRIGPVGLDGVVLVESRSIEHAHHEVRVQDGVAMACTCWPSRKGLPCSHRCAVAIRLWEWEMEVDLSTVTARALALTLITRYLDPKPARRGAFRLDEGDAAAHTRPIEHREAK
ncbi:MAG: hypothetical protein ACRDJN_32250 [Chloroflexota bacterium]